jgi:predicted Zn-dependent protease
VNTQAAKLCTIILVSVLAVSGCATNPVTGKSEFAWVSEEEEIRIGEEVYAPMQQSQGGEYDVDEDLTLYISEVGERLAAVSDRELPYEFVVLNSSVPNAWALPGGKIAINRGLLTELQSEAELAAVLGHEIVHAAARHTAQRQERATFLQLGAVGAAILGSRYGYGDYALGAASVGAQLINQTYGRGDESESDFYGMQYMSRAGYDPQGAVTLQQTFVRLSEGQQQDWLSGLFASHPPSQARVDANIETAASLPQGGELGVERYRAAMQMTRDAKPAYDAYGEGLKALHEGNADDALDRAESAIEMFPEEANFYALRGDARIAKEQYAPAVDDFDSAIERRDSYFYYYARRGQLHEEFGRDDAAVADLERSIEYLPTGGAYYSLGNIAEKRGQTGTAIDHYRKVASGSGDLADAARGRLAVLDIANNPGDYIQHRCDADSQGQLIVSVRNNTPIAVSGVEFVVQVTAASGGVSNLPQRVGGQIEPGAIAQVATGLGPYTSGAGCPVRITAARAAR